MSKIKKLTDGFPIKNMAYNFWMDYRNMELQLHKLFGMHFFKNSMCLTEAGKLAQGSL